MPGRKVLQWVDKDGVDLFLYPFTYLQTAVHKKDRKTIYYWEDCGYIPIEYVIKVKGAHGTQIDRYYTEHTLRMMRKWFPQAKTRVFFRANLRAKIRELFKSEYEHFQGSKFVGIVDYEVAKAKRAVLAQKEKDQAYTHDLHADEIESATDVRDKGEWSYGD